MTPELPPTAPFSEKEFYLRGFRGRTLLFVAPPGALAGPGAAALRGVLEELAANGIRSVVLAPEADALGRGLALPLCQASSPRIEGEVWRALGRLPRLGVVVAAGDFGGGCRDLAVRLGAHKLVWLDPEGGLSGAEGQRVSFVDLEELRRLRARPGTARRLLLREVEALLGAGVEAVNVCSAEGLADELFSYQGSGTLFTRERYVVVRRLSIDDYDAAHDLVSRGVGEGYLAPRTPDEIDRVLANGFGAFVEGRHLAGIAALLVYPAHAAGEIACLYTLTRFLGEGVGGHLLAFARRRALDLGLAAVFACTTQERVGRFFERFGFRPVSPDALPAERWKGYDPERKARVLCYRLGSPA